MISWKIPWPNVDVLQRVNKLISFQNRRQREKKNEKLAYFGSQFAIDLHQDSCMIIYGSLFPRKTKTSSEMFTQKSLAFICGSRTLDTISEKKLKALAIGGYPCLSMLIRNKFLFQFIFRMYSYFTLDWTEESLPALNKTSQLCKKTAKKSPIHCQSHYNTLLLKNSNRIKHHWK